MPGFPNRITRSSLGPSYQNAAKLGNPKQEADASVFNLLCWQAAGMNLVVPKGIVVGLDDGNGNLSVVQQGFVWDPDQQLAPMVFTKTGTGVWDWVLPGSGSYPDMNGNIVPAGILFTDPKPAASTDRIMNAMTDGDGNSGSMYCFFANTGTATNIGGPGAPRHFLVKFY